MPPEPQSPEQQACLTRPFAAGWAASLRAQLQAAAPAGPLRLDLSAVARIDSAGAALLVDFARQAAGRQLQLEVVGLQEPVARTLQMLSVPAQPAALPPPPGFFESLGDNVQRKLTWLRAYLQLCADVLYFAAGEVRHRQRRRGAAVAMQMASMGSQAAGVVALIAFLVGSTIALQSAEQLRQFGANLFVADLIGVSVVRELGPLITAIVVAGRSGAAVAAELGTMQVSEEIDALRTMGIHPVRYVVVPKLWAICLVQPLLTVMASAVAIGGGFVVAVTSLDVAPAAFGERLQVALLPQDIATGLFKSLLFAFLILTLGARCGLHTQGGAHAVGRSTTLSVVLAIFAIICADALCSLLFFAGP